MGRSIVWDSNTALLGGVVKLRCNLLMFVKCFVFLEGKGSHKCKLTEKYRTKRFKLGLTLSSHNLQCDIKRALGVIYVFQISV